MDIKDIVVDEKIDTNFLPAYFAIYDRAMNAFSIINECNRRRFYGYTITI